MGKISQVSRKNNEGPADYIRRVLSGGESVSESTKALVQPRNDSELSEEAYQTVRKQMKSLIRMAKEVIEEIEKDQPGRDVIEELVADEMPELLKESFDVLLKYSIGMLQCHSTTPTKHLAETL